MKLEDIAKFTIDEVNAQLQGTSDAVAKNGFIVEEANEYTPNDFAKKEPAKSEFELVKEPTIQINQAPIRQTPEPAKQNNATQIKEILAAKVASIDNMDKQMMSI